MSQTRKILLQLVALLVVGGGLGGYAWFGIFKKDQQNAKKTDHDLRLFAPQKLDERQTDGGAAPADFSTVRVTVGTETTTLSKIDGVWWITSPVRARADKLVIDGLLSHLQTAKFKDTLDEAPDAAVLAKYGLTPPQWEVEATATVNGEQRTVRLIGGLENLFDGSIYVRRNDEPAVYQAEGGVRFMLSRTTFDLRDKFTFAIDEPAMTGLAVKSGANDYALERDPASRQWNLVRPEREPADAPSVTSMIAGLAQERAQAFWPDSPENRREFGLEAPLFDAKVTYADGGTLRLRGAKIWRDAGVGPDGEGGDVYFGLREDPESTTLARLGNGIMQLDRNPSDLRDRAVVRFRRELVTKIVFHDAAAGPDVVVQRDAVDASAESWKVTAPRAGKAKVFKVTGALWTLGAFKALAPGEEHPKDWNKYGLGDKARWVAVFGEDGKELARLTIGFEVLGTPSAFYVRGTRDQVLQSDGSRFGEFPFRLSDVLDEPGVDGGATP